MQMPTKRATGKQAVVKKREAPDKRQKQIAQQEKEERGT
jgi:hypothetical protein